MLVVRRAKPEDALGIHEAHMRSIREVCSKDHSVEEIQGWGYRPFHEEQRVRAIKNQYVWVVENSGKIEGYGHLNIIHNDQVIKGHFNALYLVPEVLGLGLGLTMTQAMINEARNNKVTEINLESTLTAHAFYKKIGFSDSGPQGVIELGGVKIRYLPMQMIL